MANGKTYECAVTRNDPIIRIVSPHGGDGITINWDSACRAGLTLAQLDLLSKCKTGMVPFTADEMRALLVIRDKRPAAERPAAERPAAERPAAEYHKPISDTAMRIADHTLASGRRIDDEELKAKQLEQSYQRLKGDLFDLTYDIPTSMPEANRNPDSEWWKGDFRVYFWRLAFHRQGSCWTFNEEGFNHPYVKECIEYWKQCGVRKVDVVRIHPDDTETVRNICYRELAEHIAKVQSSLIENLDAVSARFEKIRQEANEQSPIDRAESRADCEIRNHLRNAQIALENAIECAQRFDITENLDDLFQACRSVVRGRTLLFNTVMTRKGKKGVD